MAFEKFQYNEAEPVKVQVPVEGDPDACDVDRFEDLDGSDFFQTPDSLAEQFGEFANQKGIHVPGVRNGESVIMRFNSLKISGGVASGSLKFKHEMRGGENDRTTRLNFKTRFSEGPKGIVVTFTISNESDAIDKIFILPKGLNNDDMTNVYVALAKVIDGNEKFFSEKNEVVDGKEVSIVEQNESKEEFRVPDGVDIFGFDKKGISTISNVNEQIYPKGIGAVEGLSYNTLINYIKSQGKPAEVMLSMNKCPGCKKSIPVLKRENPDKTVIYFDHVGAMAAFGEEWIGAGLGDKITRYPTIVSFDRNGKLLKIKTP